MNLFQAIDQVAVVCHPHIEGKGEDSFSYCVGEDIAFAGVFDGCGGSGATCYELLDNHTGAYIGSRIASGIFNDYFSNEGAAKAKNEWVRDISGNLTSVLKLYKKSDTNPSMFAGSLVKDFPTTAAASVVKSAGNRISTTFIWAGDSRGYVLHQGGLKQCTVDDISEADAMSNLTGDGVLTNMISGSKFVLHEKEILVDSPAVILCSTDGCFAYLLSPMHFEYMLLKCLMESDCMSGWEKKIDAYLKPLSGDDYTLTMIVLGFGDFRNIQKYYRSRFCHLEKTYISVWNSLKNDEEKIALWKKYHEETERLV